jgi:hypothetical protein
MYLAEREFFADDAEIEERVNQAEEDRFFKTLLEEMSNLEAEHEQFEATAKVLRENVDHHAGEEP